MRVCLFEDRKVAHLEPLTATRPAFDLVCGQTSLGSKQLRHFAPCEAGFLVRPLFVDLLRLHHPSTPINDLAWLRAEPAVLVNSRWLPPPDAATSLTGPCVAMIEDEVAYAVIGPDRLTYCSPNTLEDCLESWKNSLPRHAAGGRLINYLWELVDHNADQLRLDFEHETGCSLSHPVTLSPRHPVTPSSRHIQLVGPPDRLLVDPAAQIDPLVVVDTTRGPVVIEREAVVTAFSRLEGPCYIGPQTHVLGAKIRAGTTLGPQCRIGGEVEASIVHGYSNKYHDGFLGHSYVGEWVNLGAGTTNSDLRNDYGEVTVTVNGRPVPTGRSKVGCFIGDHTKSGLGTLLNTGSNIGVFANLLPSGTLLPKYIPAFGTWWNGALADRTDLPHLLQTAATVMRRRGCTFTEVHAALFRTLFDQTAAERRQVLLLAEQRRLRRSA
jgi:UDP-N-acetylglucosamine diphosphorylase/glucosamine-1-phosphate N-acetyltransferase